MPYNRAAFGDSEDDERSDQELQALPSPAHSPPHNLPQPLAIPSNADLDKRKVMLVAGWPNYETVLCDTDIHMRPDSENFPSKRCGGPEEKPGEPI